MRSFILTIVPLALAAPIVAAPLATSTVLDLPGMGTMTLGFIGPSEVPNAKAVDLADLPLLPRDPRTLQSRQIRIANEDLGPDAASSNGTSSALQAPSTLSQDSSTEMAKDATELESQLAADAPGGGLVRRQVRLMDHDIAPAASGETPVSALEDPSLVGKREESSSSDGNSGGPNLSGATKTASDAFLILDEAWRNGSAGLHSLLGAIFGTDSTTGSPNGLHDTVANLRREHPESELFDGMPMPIERTQLWERHSLMLDTDALIPEAAPTLSAGALPTPVPAYQDMGLVDIDSNTPPPPDGYLGALPKNATGINPSSAIPTSALPTSALPVAAATNVPSVADAKVPVSKDEVPTGKNVTDAAKGA